MRLRMLDPGCLFSSVLVMALLLPSAAQAERRLSLAAAVDLALKQNPELLLEQTRVQEAEANRKSVRGNFGPRLNVEGNVLIWDSALGLDFGFSSIDSKTMEELKTDPAKAAAFAKQYNLTVDELLALSTKSNQDLLSALFKLMGLSSMDMTVREQVTAQLQVTVAQPLTALLQVYKGYKAAGLMEQAAGIELELKRLQVAFKVAETYLRLMQAQRFEAIARTGVEQVEAHVKQALSFQAAGLIGKQEVLKAQVELARAKERVIQVNHGIRLARAGLALMLGLPLSEEIQPEDTVADPPPPLSRPLDSLIREAQKQRGDLRSLDLKRQAAEAAGDAILWSFLPQITAIATYQYTYGQGTFMPENAFFGGGVLKWEVWDWGGKYYSMKAADARARQAELGHRLLREAVALEVQQAYLDLHKALEALEVNRSAIAEAEEGFRIEKKRFESNSATSTDVLDAQLAHTRAQLTYTTALYDYYIARAALARAMGLGQAAKIN